MFNSTSSGVKPFRLQSPKGTLCCLHPQFSGPLCGYTFPHQRMESGFAFNLMFLRDNVMVETTGLGVTQIHLPLSLWSPESKWIFQAPGSRLTDATIPLAAMGFLLREIAASVGLAFSGDMKGPLVRVALVYYYPNKIHLWVLRFLNWLLITTPGHRHRLGLCGMYKLSVVGWFGEVTITGPVLSRVTGYGEVSNS